MTSPCSSAFSTAHRVGDRIFGRAPDMRTATEPARTTRFAQFHETVILVTHGANSGAAGGMHLSDLSRG